MSENEMFSAIDEALKTLDPNYNPVEEVCLAEIWVTNYSEMVDAEVMDVLMTPWDAEPIRSGLRTKTVPYFFSESVIPKIVESWQTMPNPSRDMLIEKLARGEGGEAFIEAVKKLL